MKNVHVGKSNIHGRCLFTTDSLNEVDNFNVDNILGCAIKAKARIQFMLLMLQVGRIEKAEESLNKALLHLNRIISYNNKTSN